MATNIVMPALGMAQETGKLLQWLKREGERVEKGELLMQIETDKVTVEIEAPASGVLAHVTAAPGSDVRVGQVIALILAPGESAPSPSPSSSSAVAPAQAIAPSTKPASHLAISPVAARMAAEHQVDLSQIKPRGSRIEKADVQAFIQKRSTPSTPAPIVRPGNGDGARLVPASPKARRLAAERWVDLATLNGSGPHGAVLVRDVPAQPAPSLTAPSVANPEPGAETLSTVWRVMAERTTASWTSVPHFYLVREVEASGLVEMRARLTPAVEKRSGHKPTYSDLLLKLLAMALRDHPRLMASWKDGAIQTNREINIGLATATDEGLVVPVLAGVDRLSVGEIATRRHDLTERANAGRLALGDISGGVFTLSNLGMYNVDAFNAIINAPQAAILAVGRIADRVVPVDGQPAVRPMITLTLGCDHRVVDGARAARFLDDLANLIQEPWGVLA